MQATSDPRLMLPLPRGVTNIAEQYPSWDWGDKMPLDEHRVSLKHSLWEFAKAIGPIEMKSLTEEHWQDISKRYLEDLAHPPKLEEKIELVDTDGLKMIHHSISKKRADRDTNNQVYFDLWAPELVSAIMALELPKGWINGVAYFREQVKVFAMTHAQVLRMADACRCAGWTGDLTEAQAVLAIFKGDRENNFFLFGRRAGRTTQAKIQLMAKIRLFGGYLFLRRQYLRSKYVHRHKGRVRRKW